MHQPLHGVEERYQQIFTYSNDAIFLLDPKGDRIVDANARACSMLGYSYPELLETSISGVHPGEMDRMRAFTSAVLADGHAWTDELSCFTKSGETLPAEISASAVHIEGRLHVIAMVRDVSERKRMSAALEESRAHLAQVLESAMDAILVLDDQRCVTLCNRAATTVFHCASDVLVGLPLARLVSERFRELLDVAMREFSESRWTQHYMWAEGLTAFRADGESFPADISVSPFELAGKRYMTIILRDATIRRRGEEELQRVRRENVRLQAVIRSDAPITDLVGSSSAMRQMIERVRKVAATDSTVLVLGETGTGKGAVARYLHQISRRASHPMMTVNCATLSAGLIESELFGHEKGAFTGAIARKLGRFELADRGTLFLDEVGELSLDLQVKLLRILQEGEFERVGSATVRTADVRVIAATNRDLRQCVAGGTFREDLYYRLDVFPVPVPPLRARLDDIPELAHYFVNKVSKKIGRRIDSISPQVFDTLAAYAWPGNVRELEHIIERGVILTAGSRLEPGDWLPRAAPLPQPRTGRTLEEYERQHILDALHVAGWKVSGPIGAAKRLGIKPTTLNARMKKLGIARPR